MTVCYGWLVEELENDSDDPGIVDTLSFPLLVEARQWTAFADLAYFRIGLVRDVGTDWDGLTDRQWAYLDADGALPDEFDGGASIPQRFRRELEQAA